MVRANVDATDSKIALNCSRTYALLTRNQVFEIASLRRNDCNWVIPT